MRWWRERSLRQQWAITVTGFILVPLVLLGAGALTLNTVFSFDETPAAKINCSTWEFDRAVWHEPSSRRGEGRTKRERVGLGLAKCQPIQGHTRTSVRRLLGPPDSREGHREWIYVLGTDFTGDDNILLISFDSRGRADKPVVSGT